ncbi:hypothetical protein M8J76_012090 [Diaphorina citri]|nr:hypothetical protein M8J76_012090 [Diaphorina citri]
MDCYWSHYAKVMEYNRQRILLQNPNASMSFYDIPSRLLTRPQQGNLSNPIVTVQHLCDLTNSSKSSKRNSKKSRRNNMRFCPNRMPSNSSTVTIEVSEQMETDMEECNANDSSSSKLEFVIDDGFMKFLEISMEHKLKRKKQLQAEKQREKLKEEEELAKGTNLMGVKHKERKDYKRNLYGLEADKIMAMENAMDITFNQQKDLNKPVLWPNLALNLKF